ncbi:MAG: 30S ribosomal protein S4 [Tissierellia bacterium]|nr:30S ribosomal protein S4 [Tissierellia bacterium]
MSSLYGPRVKIVRRLGLNVFNLPKANKGMKKGASRADKKLSNYGEQLLEKQRLRAYYQIPENQMLRYFDKARKSKDQTGHALLKLLETRLDNLVYRAGFASSIRQARQMVVHGHIRVNNKKVDRPSFQVEVGDVLSLRDKSRQNEMFKDNFQSIAASPYPYMERDAEKFSAKLIKMPEREEIPVEIQDVYVVEYYSH